ncbi:ABC transporter G family member 2 [Striga hermonthica]|uniref:ABC transporter G family member 2 n=1 Tax=Striga hermonthica TaxID=68872 RepID=A0A9N7RGY4_STRHE|nr:ABC transporter G family member 2 [Striga hermonthica]
MRSQAKVPQSPSDSPSMTSALPFLGPRHFMELQEFSRRNVRSMPHTLGELMQYVGDQSTDPNARRILQIRETDFSRPPKTPFVLYFRNLTYSIKIRRKIIPSCFNNASKSGTTKILLDGISGQASEGEIMAILGASGSGKSTLIDALAGRISRESLQGTVTLNDKFLDPKLLKAISAYVMQDDLLHPMLTVEETLMFSAEFRLPWAMPRSEKKARVGALISKLGLEAAAGTVIGDEGRRGVSGGERRRVSIGTHIVHDPILLFLDEPTSGLDSTSAHMTIRVLRQIALGGSIVILLIHQPSYRILRQLDRLIVLSRGQAVFDGPPGALPSFFTAFGSPIPTNEDKTEFALDFIRELEGTPCGTRNLADFNRKWHEGKKKNQSSSSTLENSTRASISTGEYANPMWREILVIAKRSFTNSRRSPEQFSARLIAILVTSAILATVFRNLDNSPRGVQERFGFFAFAISTTFYTCAEAMPAFLLDRHIFARETAHNAYRRSSYVVSHSAASVPSISILSAVFAAATYWAVGLSGGPSGFVYYFSFIMAAFWAGSSFVTFLSGIISNMMAGYTVVVAILAYFMLFSGFFIDRDRIPKYWLWFHYTSLVKYPYEGVMRNEFGDGSRCFVRGVQVFDGTALKDVPHRVKLNLLESISRSLGKNINGSTCLMAGPDILKQRGVVDLDIWSCLWITVALGFLFRVLFYFALLFGSKNKRR